MKLAPEETLGRRFQYAFASIALARGIGVKVDPAKGVMEFPSGHSYHMAVETASRYIVDALTQRRPISGCRSEARIHGVDCCTLNPGPQLYAAGGKYESAIFIDAGLTAYSIEVRGKKQVRWTHAALSYAAIVAGKRGPVGGGSYDIPWTAKATLFSKRRAPLPGIGKVRHAVDIDTLGTILLGGALSYLGRYRAGAADIEYYLVPEYPSEGYARIRAIASLGGVGVSSDSNLAGIITWLTSGLSVSFEAALAAGVAAKIAQAAVDAEKLDREGVAGTTRLVTIRPQQRPMVTGSSPLTLSVALSFSGDTVSTALSLAGSVMAQMRRAPEGLLGAEHAVSRCINALFLQSQDPCWTDHLVECVRELDALSASARGPVAGLSARLKGLLVRDYERLVSEVCI